MKIIKKSHILYHNCQDTGDTSVE